MAYLTSTQPDEPWIDTLARAAVAPRSRREVLRIAVAAGVATIMPSLAPRSVSGASGTASAPAARAAQGGCPPPANLLPIGCENGVRVGVASMADIRDCPHLVSRSGYRPPCNDCGSGPFGWAVPNRPLGFDFLSACLTHDVCYGTCGSRKADCDRQFGKDMLAKCPKFLDWDDDFGYIGAEICSRLAALYEEAVSSLGQSAWESGQLDGCECCVCRGGCGPCERCNTTLKRCESLCAEGQACCDGTCTDVRSDRRNCGACGHECQPGEACVDGHCVGGPYVCVGDPLCSNTGKVYANVYLCNVLCQSGLACAFNHCEPAGG